MTDPAGSTPLPACPSRRALLAAAAGAGSLAALGACAGAPATGPQASDTPGPTAAPGDAGARQRLAGVGDVPVGGGTVVSGVLIVQPTAGRFRAYAAACPHQGIRLSPPRDGVITCSAHMSRFREGDGAVLGGPAPRGLTKVRLSVEGEAIYRA
jgi:nitrite reductase/ring-hydroxylating ferredoxin subunit